MSGAVLITGAAGFVGRAVGRALAESGVRVTGLDSVPLDPAERARSGFERFLVCDVLDTRALAETTRGAAFERVVHLAGLRPDSSLRDLFAVNVGGTSAVLEHLVRPGGHLIFFSTGLVYGPQPAPFREDMACMPQGAYARSKLAAEALVHAHARACGAAAAVLRPSVLYGPHAPAGMLLGSLVRALARGEPFAMTAGDQRRDFLHVDDAARAVVRLLERRAAGTWNLAFGESVTVRQAAELAASLARRQDLLRIGALPYRDGELFDYRLDAAALQRAIDWQPRIGLADGLKRLWEELS